MRTRGYASLYLAATVFAFTSLFVKLASRYYAGLFISAMRFAMGVVLCLIVIFLRYRDVKLNRPGLVILRGIFGAASMAATYIAISLTGPGRGALLSNTYPLFVAIFGALFFGEPFRPRTLVSIGICSPGAFLVVRDGSGASVVGELVAIGGALCAGMGVCLVRALAKDENNFVLYLSPCLFGLPLFAVAPMHASGGGLAGLVFLAGVGGGAFVAQSVMNRGYRSVPAGRGSVVFYWETALTVFLGCLFAGERFNPRFGLGLVVIVFGLWSNRERKGERTKTTAERLSP